MKHLKLNIENSSDENLYMQIFDQLRDDILSGELSRGTKLPSLRAMASDNGVSITTVETAYNQLLVEGYITSRPKSGYYVSDSITGAVGSQVDREPVTLDELLPPEGSQGARNMQLIYDEQSFEFSKWKKCMNKVFNEYSHLLQTEAEVKGEAALRYEIARYLFAERGVRCSPDQVVIGAGSQQLTTHLVRILRELGISHAATETPGYGPVRDIFKDENFTVQGIPVGENGIEIEMLPKNVRSVVYICPSNQFPSGAVMPVGRRYELIKWAVENDSFIYEDDYDSELRYFGKPIPALQGLDTNGRVIYLGSFSSTLFASIKISYMVLPPALTEIFDRISSRYSQTCSKAEQICLALYMENGYYHRNIKKVRRMNAHKLETTMKMFEEYGGGLVEAVDSHSGLAVLLKVHTAIPAEELCRIGAGIGLKMRPVDDLCTDDMQILSFYFYRVSDSLLKILVRMFVQNIKKHLAERR
jgi:GntR family transcriptional regulator/MocR family aminotransferase